MSEAEANAALMRRYYEEVFNRRNLAFLRAPLHPQVVGHGPGDGPPFVENARAQIV